MAETFKPELSNSRSTRIIFLHFPNGRLRKISSVLLQVHNNIIWNQAHLICAQQSMCYVRAGLPITISDNYFSPYLPGTKPERFVDGAEIDAIKELLISTLDQLQVDVDQDAFNNYPPSAMTPKVYGIEVNSIDDALNFLLYHEGFHSGYIIALKHAV